MNAANKTEKLTGPADRIPPHRIVPKFLGDDLIGRLLEHANAHDGDFVPSKTLGSSIEPGSRVSLVLRDFGGLREVLDARFREVLPGAVEDIRLAPFELARCEIELVAHNDGAFFKPHIDTAINTKGAKSQRVLTGVLYFHAMPKGFSGGQLRLYSFVGEDFVDIEPECNCLVLFPAWVPHEVLPISCPSGEFAHSRFAINCWYHRPNQHAASLL